MGGIAEFSREEVARQGVNCPIGCATSADRMSTLTVITPDLDPRKVVETIEELLMRAKAGEFESFVAVCMRTDGTFCTRASGHKNGLEIIGALACVSKDMIESMEQD